MIRHIRHAYDFALAIRNNARGGKEIVVTGSAERIRGGNSGSLSYCFEAHFTGERLPWDERLRAGEKTEQIRHVAPPEEVEYHLEHLVDSQDTGEESGIGDFISLGLEYVRAQVNDVAPGLSAFIEGSELFVGRRR